MRFIFQIRRRRLLDGVDVRRHRRRRRELFDTNVAIEVKKRIQTNSIEHQRCTADDKEIRIASKNAF